MDLDPIDPEDVVFAGFGLLAISLLFRGYLVVQVVLLNDFRGVLVLLHLVHERRNIRQRAIVCGWLRWSLRKSTWYRQEEGREA
jgi:hypothetical protein